MALTGTTDEEKIWNYLSDKLGNAYGVAGLMGNLYAESALNPKNLQNTYETKLGYTDDTYTAAVDDGSYTNFVKDSAGYGLAQWTYWSRKQALLTYVQEKGKSVGDLETQLGFLYQEISTGYASVLTVLKNAASVRAASDAVLTKYEKPADQSASVQEKRASYGRTYYNKYAGASSAQTTTGGNTMTESELRKLPVNYLVQYLGITEGSTQHKAILAVFNNSKLCTRYTMTVNDAWCATAVSAAFIATGLSDIFPCVECSCTNMVTKAKTAGIWQESDSYSPSVGDVILYDWDDSGSGDNTGTPDHVGIVSSVSGSAFKVIEGNKSDTVGYRSMTVNGKYIRGYILPKYSSKATASSSSTSGSTSTGTSSGSFKVGDGVNFTGTAHYPSSNSTAAKTCKPGKAKITQIYASGKHPYHLVAVSGGGSNVYGWVDSGTFTAASASTSTTAQTATITTLQSAPNKESGYSAGKTYKTTTALNLRYGPSAEKLSNGKDKYGIITTLAKGTQVTYHGYYATTSGTKWLYVAVNGKTGWVSSKYLT